jgi:putative heme-binding domain-containing protein
VALLANRNEWYARMARQLLAERHDAQVYPLLRRQIAAQRGPLALESLWTLYASGGWDSGFALKCLDHANEDVRAWTVRLLGDAGKVNPAMAERLALLAQTEPSAVVRNQLACSAKRLPGPDALPIIAALLHRDADVGDPMIPLLLWWALENKAVSDRDAVLAMWQQPETWTAPMARKFITERLARRYAQEGGSENLRSCARLLDLAPDPGARDEVLSGMSQAYDGRVLPAVPPELAAAVEHLWEQGKPSGLLIRFAARVGSPEGLSRAHAMAADSNEPFGQRVAAITLLGQAGDEQSEAVLLNIAEGSAPDGASQGGGSQAAPDAPVSPSEALRADALAALSAFSDPALARRLITLYPRLSPALRQKARASLEARPSSALALLRAVDSGALPAGEIPLAEVRPMSALGGEALASLILKHYGKVTAQAAGVQRSMAREVEDIVLLRVHHTDWKAGRETFRRTCSACHTLFGEGGHIGPDLTTVDRQSVEFLAANIVAPSLTIRPEFIAYNVTLKDGRVLNGFLASADDETVAVRDVADHVTTVPRSQVAKLEGSSVSLMPEGLLEAMTAQQIADLFAYIQRRSASGN